MNVRLSVALLTLALVGPGPARAELVDYSYALSVSPHQVAGAGGTQASAFYNPAGTGSALLGSFAGGGQVSWQFSASSGKDVDVSADVRLTLTDLASGRAGQLDFPVHFHGVAGGFWSSSQPTADFSTDVQSVRLGDYLYHVSPFHPAQITDGPTEPIFAFAVSVSSAASAQAPEPSSLALAGVAGLGLAVRRRRRGRAGRAVV